MVNIFDQEYVWNLERERIREEACAEVRNEIIQNMLAENIRPDVIAEVIKIPVEHVVAIGKKAIV